MFHVMAFEEDVDNTANTELDLIPDQIANGEAGQAYFQEDMDLFAMFVAAATITRARLTSPTLRQVFIPYIVPLNGAVTPATDPNIADMRENPMKLKALERFVPEVTSGVAMGTERAYAVLFVRSRLVPAPSGPIVTLRATGTTTLVQGVWTDVTLTWDQQLARGTYAIIGGHLQSATAVAWRLILENQVLRPGGLGVTALTNRSWLPQYGGGIGSWGQFFSTGLPRLQVMANAGDTTENLFLQVVRIGPG